MTKIEETLKKIAAATSKVSGPISSNTETRPNLMAGDPNCPICGGLGYLRQELPVGHPDFGKVVICSCRQAEVSQAIKQKLFQVSNLGVLSHLTFDTFQTRRIGLSDKQNMSLEMAFNNSRRFAAEMKGWLLLLGGYGCGKTHLAAAIANFAVDLGVPTLFITVPDLLDWLRFSYGAEDTSFEERFDEIRNTGLLVMDDFGTQNATAWAQEKLFQIMNYRYINRLPTVITSNQSMDEIEGRLRSRLQDSELVSVNHILAPDYRRPTDDTRSQELSILAMHQERTFANFNLRKSENRAPEDQQSLEKAYREAKRYAENPTGWLVIGGPTGCGKTHLAAAIGNFRAGQGYPPLMVVVPDLLDQLRSTFSPSSNVTYDQRFEQYKTAELLILDDLGTESATPWAKEKLYQLINYRYIAKLPTVFTTSILQNKLDERFSSRMLDRNVSVWVDINMPAYYSSQRRETGRGRPQLK